MTNTINIPILTRWTDCNGDHAAITAYAEVTPDLARRIVLATGWFDNSKWPTLADSFRDTAHQSELGIPKMVERIAALEDRTSAIAEIQRDDHEKGMPGRISALEKQVEQIHAWDDAHAKEHDVGDTAMCGRVEALEDRLNGVTKPDVPPAADASGDDAAVLAKIATAESMVFALCQPLGTAGKREWTMSIPARPDHDPDLVIADALDTAGKYIISMHAELARVTAEREADDSKTEQAMDLLRDQVDRLASELAESVNERDAARAEAERLRRDLEQSDAVGRNNYQTLVIAQNRAERLQQILGWSHSNGPCSEVSLHQAMVAAQRDAVAARADADAMKVSAEAAILEERNKADNAMREAESLRVELAEIQKAREEQPEWVSCADRMPDPIISTMCRVGSTTICRGGSITEKESTP